MTEVLKLDSNSNRAPAAESLPNWEAFREETVTNLINGSGYTYSPADLSLSLSPLSLQRNQHLKAYLYKT